MTNSILESACYVQGAVDAVEYLNRVGVHSRPPDPETFRRLVEEADNLRRFVMNCVDNARVMDPGEFYEWTTSQLGWRQGESPF